MNGVGGTWRAHVQLLLWFSFSDYTLKSGGVPNENIFVKRVEAKSIITSRSGQTCTVSYNEEQ